MTITNIDPHTNLRKHIERAVKEDMILRQEYDRLQSDINFLEQELADKKNALSKIPHDPINGAFGKLMNELYTLFEGEIMLQKMRKESTLLQFNALQTRNNTLQKERKNFAQSLPDLKASRDK